MPATTASVNTMSRNLRIQRLDVPAQPERELERAEGMLADAAHGHNPDARVGYEHLVGNGEIGERQSPLLYHETELRRLPLHDRAQHARDAGRVELRRRETAVACHEKVARSPGDQAIRRVEHQDVEIAAGDLCGGQHVVEAVE